MPMEFDRLANVTDEKKKRKKNFHWQPGSSDYIPGEVRALFFLTYDTSVHDIRSGHRNNIFAGGLGWNKNAKLVGVKKNITFGILTYWENTE